MLSGIYRIDGPNGVYIGSAVNLDRRIKRHKYELNLGTHQNSKLRRSWNKYGPEAFTFSVLETTLDKSKLLYYEQIWLDILFSSLPDDQVYNTCKIAGSRQGQVPSRSQRDKVSIALKGRKHSKERIENIRLHRPKNITPNAKTHDLVLIGPDGIEHTHIFNLAAFRREHGLNKKSLYNLIKGKIRSHKGWTYKQSHC